MGIYQFPVPIPMTNGEFPQFKFAVFGDNLSTVTTAGYLNQSTIQAGIPLSNADVIQALYSFNLQTRTGTFGIFTVNIAASTGLITLTSWSNPGDAVLPTTAGYIAHFTNTTGTISSGPANVTNPGSIGAGFSGQVGALFSYPATASTGKLAVAAASSAGDYQVTITNNSFGQSSSIFIPDPVAATADFVLAPSALVSGNLVQASGTAGLVVDSTIATANLMKLNTTNAMTSTGSITMTKVNGTESGNAVTASGVAGVITTSSLSTAGGGSYAITWTNTKITATSVVLLSISGGTNTTQNITMTAVPGSGTATLTIYNNTAATALNGTIFISYLVM